MIIAKARRTIIRYGMLSRGDKVLVGVSGGADSVALVHALFELKDEWNLSLMIAHLNHSFRGEESELEAGFVEELASRLNLPFESMVIDVPAAQKGSGKSAQEMARELRYRFFEEVSKRYGANRVALGHNGDDQAESVLMRFLQGAGTRGLSGIPPRRDHRYIRPLIEVSRKEIEDYLEEKDISFMTDSSNKKEVYLRNKIRLRLFPLLLNDYNPRLKENLIHLSSIMRKDDEYLEEVVEKISPGLILTRGDNFVTLDASAVLDLHEALQSRIIRKFIAAVAGDLQGVSYLHLQAVLDMLRCGSPNRSIDLPRRVMAIKEYDKLTLRSGGDKLIPQPFFYRIGSPEAEVNLKEVGQVMKLTVSKNPFDWERKDFARNFAHFDLDKIHFPLIVRNFRKGDRFQPLGMKGKKKVKDYFIDEKIPLAKRRETPLLISGETIIWVAGYRIDNRVRVGEGTKKVLKVKMVPLVS